MTLLQGTLLAFIASIPFNLVSRWAAARSVIIHGSVGRTAWKLDTAGQLTTSVLFHTFMALLVIDLFQKAVEIPVIVMVVVLEVVAFVFYNPLVIAIRQASER